jgi:hypothetical protein
LEHQIFVLNRLCLYDILALKVSRHFMGLPSFAVPGAVKQPTPLNATAGPCLGFAA